MQPVLDTLFLITVEIVTVYGVVILILEAGL